MTRYSASNPISRKPSFFSSRRLRLFSGMRTAFNRSLALSSENFGLLYGTTEMGGASGVANNPTAGCGGAGCDRIAPTVGIGAGPGVVTGSDFERADHAQGHGEIQRDLRSRRWASWRATCFSISMNTAPGAHRTQRRDVERAGGYFV